MTTSTTAVKVFSNKIIKKTAAALFWVAVWEAAYLVVNQDLLIASPVQVIRRLSQLMWEAPFGVTVAHSMARIMCGYALGVIFAVILAVCAGFSSSVHSVAKPFMVVVKSTPVASFIILALVWMKTGSVPTFISFLMVLPIVWTNIMQGVKQTNSQLLEVAKIFKLSKYQTLKKIYIPCTLPYFTAGCTTGLGLAWKAGIAAEVLAVPKNSIGLQLYDSKIYLETVDLFAWTLTVILFSMILEFVLNYVTKKVFKKYHFNSQEAE